MLMQNGSQPEVQTPPENGTGDSVTTYLDAIIQKIQREAETRQRLFADRFTECPGECWDGRLRTTDETGREFSCACWLMAADCPYGKRQRRQLRDFFYNSLTASAIPAIHRNALFETKQTEALTAAHSWHWQHKPILLLLGAKGIGKSYAAARAYLRWVLQNSPKDLWQTSNRWQEFADDAASALCWMHIYKLVNDRDSAETAARAPFLVLDDLASEDATPGGKARVNYVISERYDNLKPTVITGNLSVKDFVERYGERIFDRISHYGTIANCTGENLREAG